MDIVREILECSSDLKCIKISLPTDTIEMFLAQVFGALRANTLVLKPVLPFV